MGIDLGDRKSRFCVVDSHGDEIEVGAITMTKLALEQRFSSGPKLRIALEAGAQSGWVSRLLIRLGHEVYVANPRDLALITRANNKTDKNDARKLAQLARVDPQLLSPIQHRSEQAQIDLVLFRARHALIRTRTVLVNNARCVVKSFGERLPKCSTPAFADKVEARIPDALRGALLPMIEMIRAISAEIRSYNRKIAELAQRYPAVTQLEQVIGVGNLTATAYVLTLEDPTRFRKSRDVGPYLGLVPRRRQSGDSDPQLRITKAGDTYLRTLLVQSAQYILGPLPKDSDLRRWGLGLVKRMGPRGKQRAVVAVARKLAVLLHSLWTKKTEYRPLREPTPTASVAATP